MDYKRKMQAVLRIINKPNLSLWAIDYWHDVYVKLAKAEINEAKRIPRTVH